MQKNVTNTKLLNFSFESKVYLVQNSKHTKKKENNKKSLPLTPILQPPTGETDTAEK